MVEDVHKCLDLKVVRCYEIKTSTRKLSIIGHKGMKVAKTV